MAGEPSAESLLARAELAWAGGDGPAAIALFGRADAAAEAGGDLSGRVRAVLGQARGQRYNLTPGSLPVRLHAVYDLVDDPFPRGRLAAALARCWAYANEPRRARPFAIEALHLATQADDPALLADALDAALVTHWGPDDRALRRDWAARRADAAAHLADPDARLQVGRPAELDHGRAGRDQRAVTRRRHVGVARDIGLLVVGPAEGELSSENVAEVLAAADVAGQAAEVRVTSTSCLKVSNATVWSSSSA